MTAPKFSTWIAASLLLAVGGALSQAQDTPIYVDSTDHDLQFFSPVDFDFENRPIGLSCGYYFKYDKLFWGATGERVVVGDRDEIVLSEQIFGNTIFAEGVQPQQYRVNNSIQDAPPNARFTNGNRYEFGYSNGETGWRASILQGLKFSQSQRYGFENLDIPNTLPINLINEDNFSDFTFAITTAVLGLPGTGSNDLATSRNGFGSVHVNFRTPTDFLKGFVDYSINGPNNELGPTVVGPGRAVGAIVIADNGDGTFGITDITLLSGADGLPDDLDGDGVTFFAVIGQDIDGNDVFLGNGVDWDDLHTFNVAFERFIVRNVTETDGVELMRTFQLDNRHLPVKRQGEHVQLGYGVRFFRLDDEFTFDGDGGILGRTYATTSAENMIVGPQIQGSWTRQSGHWNMGVDGRFMFGYNIQNQSQIGAIGEDLAPGQVNALIFGQPHAVNYGRQQQNFSPMAEIRANLSYQITRSLAARLGYTGIFVDNITRASQTVDWYIPDLGLLHGGEQNIYINGVDFGFEAVY